MVKWKLADTGIQCCWNLFTMTRMICKFGNDFDLEAE